MTAEGRLVATTAWMPGTVPPFRLAAEDRMLFGLAGAWAPGSVLDVALAADFARVGGLADGPVSGPHRLAVDLRAHLLREPDAPLHLALGWQASTPLPRSSSSSSPSPTPLSSGETDVDLLVDAGRDLGALRADLVAGLAIRGSPLHPAEQDDAALTWLHLSGATGALRVTGRVGGTWAAPVSPDRLSAVAGLSSRCGRLGWLDLGAELGAGLTAAAPDLLAHAWIGTHRGCRLPPPAP